jgi:hypothetical protein
VMNATHSLCQLTAPLFTDITQIEAKASYRILADVDVECRQGSLEMSMEMSIIYRFIDSEQHANVDGNVDFPANVDGNVENISIF